MTPLLEVHNRPPLEVLPERLHLAGVLGVTWSRSAPGLARVKMHVHVPIATLDDAMGLAWLLPGAGHVYDAAMDDSGEEHAPVQLQAPRGLGVTLSSRIWPESDGRASGEPIEMDTDVFSVTLSSGKGKATLSVGLRGEARTTSLLALDALDGSAVIVLSEARQVGLFSGGGDDTPEVEDDEPAPWDDEG